MPDYIICSAVQEITIAPIQFIQIMFIHILMLVFLEYFGINGFSNLDSNNTDPIYIKRNKVAGNVSKLACYIGDDGTQAISNFPPTNESSPTDYFSIRATNTGNPHHSFSSTGNYYCLNSIYCSNINGTLIPTNSGGSITKINGNYMILNSPSNGGFQYNYNNSEMLRMYQSSGTNYIGNGTNNFILNSEKVQ